MVANFSATITATTAGITNTTTAAATAAQLLVV